MIDNAVDAHQSHRKGIYLLQERNEIGQSAVHAVYQEYVKGYQPDILVPEGAHYALPGLLVGADSLAAVGFLCGFLVRLQQEVEDYADHTGNGGVKENRHFQAKGRAAQGGEDRQGAEGYDGIHQSAAGFHDAEHSALFVFITQKAHGLKHGGPVKHVCADGQQTVNQQEGPVGGKGGQPQSA